MDITFDEDLNNATGTYSVNVYNAEPGTVRLDVYLNDSAPGAGAYLPPHVARELATALLRAADEAEGRKPSGALARTVAILENQYDPDEYADDPSLYGQVRAEGETIIHDVRAMVATELETLPVYNNAGPWCANINRAGAIETARNGLRKWERK